MGNRKLGALFAPIWFLGVVLAATNVEAAVGENITELIARYGEPKDGNLALILGFAEWKLEQGDVAAFLKDGKATAMLYFGVDEKTNATLLERNLPKGQKWVKSKAAKAFVLAHRYPTDEKKSAEQAIADTQFLQTRDGTLRAMYRTPALIVATPKGLETFINMTSGKAKGF